jgi:hypothetical protein
MFVDTVPEFSTTKKCSAVVSISLRPRMSSNALSRHGGCPAGLRRAGLERKHGVHDVLPLKPGHTIVLPRYCVRSWVRLAAYPAQHFSNTFADVFADTRKGKKRRDSRLRSSPLRLGQFRSHSDTGPLKAHRQNSVHFCQTSASHRPRGGLRIALEFPSGARFCCHFGT